MAATTVRRWLKVGHLHPIHPGVYAVGHDHIGREGRWLAAVLACREGSVLSHGPAGQLHRLISLREHFALHVSLPARSGGSPPGIVIHRPRNLDPTDTTCRFNIPTTTATRTIYDLASTSSPSQASRAFREAEKSALLNRFRLQKLVEAAPNRKGNGELRILLAARPLPLSETRGWLEDLLVTICADNDLALPAVSVPLLGYEVDFLWPAARFVVEADGGNHLDPLQRDKDNARDIALGRAGYLVRRYSSRAMDDEAAVASEVVSILRERGVQ